MPHSRSNADLRGHNRTDQPVVGVAEFAASAAQGVGASAQAPPIPGSGSTTEEKKEKIEKTIKAVKSLFGGGGGG